MKKFIKIKFGILLVYIVVSVLYVLIGLKNHLIYAGSDLVFHANRIEELYQNVQNGVFIPRISTHSFNNIGSGINFFYPWIMLYPFVFLRFLFHDPVYSYYAGLILINLATLLVSNYSMYKYSLDRKRAFIFSIIYTFSNYRLFLMLNNNVLAESIGMIFLPLVFLGFYEICFRNYNRWLYLAIGMTMMIYSHVLSSAMSVAFMMIIGILYIKKITPFKPRMIAGIKAIILTILLTSFWLVPFLEQTINNRLVASWVGFPNINTPTEVMSSSLNNLAEPVIGFLILLALVFGWLYLNKVSTHEKVAYWSGVVLVIMTTTIIPWESLAETPLNNLQFPWRLNGLATLMLSVYVSKIVCDLLSSDNNSRYRNLTWMSLITLLCVLLQFSANVKLINSRTNQPILARMPTYQNNDITKTMGRVNVTNESWKYLMGYLVITGGTDYQPLKFYNSNMIQSYASGHIGRVNGKKVNFTNKYSSYPNMLKFDLSSFKPGDTVELPAIYYYNDMIKVGNHNWEKPQLTKFETIKLKVPYKNKVAIIKYTDSLADKVSIVVSLISWLGLFLWLINLKLQSRKVK